MSHLQTDAHFPFYFLQLHRMPYYIPLYFPFLLSPYSLTLYTYFSFLLTPFLLTQCHTTFLFTSLFSSPFVIHSINLLPFPLPSLRRSFSHYLPFSPSSLPLRGYPIPVTCRLMEEISLSFVFQGGKEENEGEEGEQEPAKKEGEGGGVQGKYERN